MSQIEEVFAKNKWALKSPNQQGPSITNPNTPQKSGMNSPESKRRKPPVSQSTEPGTMPLFLLHSTNQFARYGETVTYSLVAMQNVSQRVCIYGQVLKPGREMYYDGSYPEGYFYSETGNGGCISGADIGTFTKIHTRMVNTDDLQGTMIINLVILDENGQLLQQILTDLYIVRGGPWALMHYVRIAKPTDMQYTLTGRFPVNTPIYYMMGIPSMGYSISGNGPNDGAVSTSGTSLKIPRSPGLENSSSLDFMGWDPVTRQAIIAPNIMTSAQ